LYPVLSIDAYSIGGIVGLGNPVPPPPPLPGKTTVFDGVGVPDTVPYGNIITRIPGGATNELVGFRDPCEKLGVAVTMIGSPFFTGVRYAEPVPIGVSWSLAPLVALPVGANVPLLDAGPKH
jgi:hypothetical protein